MIITFDFILMAQKDNILMEKIKHAVESKENAVVYTDIHKLSFCASKQSVIVENKSDSISLGYKIIPKEIKYDALLKMLDNNWECICESDIIDVI